MMSVSAPSRPCAEPIGYRQKKGCSQHCTRPGTFYSACQTVLRGSLLLVDDKTKPAITTLTNNAAAAASASLFIYVIVAVLQQSDAELILPSSVFDLGGLLDKVKEGVPGGAFVAPLLQVKIPLALFYTLGPIALLAFHAVVVLDRTALPRASTPVRLLAIWSAPAALALIRWRFAPYVSARPEPPPVGRAMEQLQTLALACDTALVATCRGRTRR